MLQLQLFFIPPQIPNDDYYLLLLTLDKEARRVSEHKLLGAHKNQASGGVEPVSGSAIIFSVFTLLIPKPEDHYFMLAHYPGSGMSEYE